MSLLCNVNLVLIFEDGFENLIQFSKNRFTSMDAFLKECKYNNVLKLTADEVIPHSHLYSQSLSL